MRARLAPITYGGVEGTNRIGIYSGPGLVLGHLLPELVNIRRG
jgi:hypothetical protein